MKKGLFLFLIVVSSFSVYSHEETHLKNCSKQVVQHSGGT